MRQVPKELVEELKSKGIVPGATCTSAAFPEDPSFIVPPASQWFMGDEGPMTGDVGRGRSCYLKFEGRYSKVLSPSSEPEGLKEGDSVECGPAMRSVIIELAKELGFPCLMQENGRALVLFHANSTYNVTHGNGCVKRIIETPKVFIERLLATPKPEPPIKIGSDKVEFRSGSIKVGCTTVDNATVRAIAEKLID